MQIALTFAIILHALLVRNFHKTLSTLCSARCVNQARVDPSWQAKSLKKKQALNLKAKIQLMYLLIT